jgi:hypothetical protein
MRSFQAIQMHQLSMMIMSMKKKAPAADLWVQQEVQKDPCWDLQVQQGPTALWKRAVKEKMF